MSDNFVAWIVALFLGVTGATAALAQEIAIGTGSRAGVYYQAGRTICRIVGRVDPVEGLACAAVSTPGSVYNLEQIRAGEMPVAVVQSDLQYEAASGTGAFAAAGADQKLRALFSVHPEPFTLVARSDSGIESLYDLAGRRVNIGNPGSGQRATMEVVMEAMGWTADDFMLAGQLPASQHSLALCHDRFDAIVYTVGHPNASIGKATGLCDARIVEVSGPEIDGLVGSRPFYVMAEVPGGLYAANPDPVTTFGVTATVVASADVDEETVYTIVSRVFGNIDTFRAAHPAFAGLDPAAMANEGLSAPLHPGAERYFAEAGLIAPEPASN